MARSNALRFGVPSDLPLYRQVVDRLRREIAGMPAGARIDSEPQLTNRFGVSRLTVARAIESLVDEGLVDRRQGLGSFVAAPTLKRAPAYLQTLADGSILDVVDAVYDARRYAYEAEIRRDRGSASLGPASLTSTEKHHASNLDFSHDFGPRLGPWGRIDGCRG
ncbi:MAG: GntR family transcriptional regulator [Roseiarcus sp.]